MSTNRSLASQPASATFSVAAIAIAGAFLTINFGWASTFVANGVFAGAVFAVIALAPGLLPAGRSGGGPSRGTYRELLTNPAYLGDALGYALVLGGLIVFVPALALQVATPATRP